jgi:hypothetical protein
MTALAASIRTKTAALAAGSRRPAQRRRRRRAYWLHGTLAARAAAMIGRLRTYVQRDGKRVQILEIGRASGSVKRFLPNGEIDPEPIAGGEPLVEAEGEEEERRRIASEGESKARP